MPAADSPTYQAQSLLLMLAISSLSRVIQQHQMCPSYQRTVHSVFWPVCLPDIIPSKASLQIQYASPTYAGTTVWSAHNRHAFGTSEGPACQSFSETATIRHLKSHVTESLKQQQAVRLRAKLPATMKPLRVKLAVGGMYISSHPQQRKYSFSPPLFMVAMLNLPHVRKKSKDRFSSCAQHFSQHSTAQHSRALCKTACKELQDIVSKAHQIALAKPECCFRTPSHQQHAFNMNRCSTCMHNSVCICKVNR